MTLAFPTPRSSVRSVTANGRQHGGRLLAAHHRDARVRPHPQEARSVGTAAHAVIAGPEAAAEDDGELRHPRAGHRRDQLGAVLGDDARLVAAADPYAGDVLQEYRGNAADGQSTRLKPSP